MGVSMGTARAWVERWERQQERYAVDREERFTVIADVVEHITAGRSRPHLLDLGCGPGSLAARLADRIPSAEIVAADMDPLLLELGRTHHADAARYVDTVIGEEGWADALRLERPLDAAVSTTALHYLSEPVLLRTYRCLAGLLRPGGVLVNGDHFPPDGAPSADLTAYVGRRRAERTGGHAHEDWRSWWDAAARDPELADLFHERERRLAALGGSGCDGHLAAGRHAELLRRAGFGHVTPVWQFGDSAVLVAVKGDAPGATAVGRP
ncbi:MULTISPECIES: class I SAM-dependent methyltransferase [Streptomyces]|uniref:Methyltransferase n=1 Tax=Streptomyces nodosus TaxID=40318 RepID=A0A0B5DDY1_9ACTN|nr:MULTISPECIES: class I SAM-dependent methyltransferase [Streptomyces]AJE39375.1 methyltransferase [Streptomyces nodosus]MYV49690.1 methyltransferase domain-containing protein [Streptomyces sp. SID2888]QEV37957.1 class I SAM-dependent methyltransferase [Streptomyces nodosus]